MKLIPRKPKLSFGQQELGICQMSLNSLDLQSGTQSAASDINAEPISFSIFILFVREIFQIILHAKNRYFHRDIASKNTGSTSAQPPDIMFELTSLFKWT
jgi:hypothetical protein